MTKIKGQQYRCYFWRVCNKANCPHYGQHGHPGTLIRNCPHPNDYVCVSVDVPPPDPKNEQQAFEKRVQTGLCDFAAALQDWPKAPTPDHCEWHRGMYALVPDGRILPTVRCANCQQKFWALDISDLLRAQRFGQ